MDTAGGVMAQLNIYVSKALEKEIRSQAKRSGRSISALIAEKVAAQPLKNWPRKFFENVVGRWQGPLEEVERPWPEEREGL